MIDRIRLSEFFALICTGLMLLTLFLLSSAWEVRPGSTISAGFPGRSAISVIRAVEREVPAPVEEETEVDIPSPKRGRIPTRSIDHDFSR